MATPDDRQRPLRSRLKGALADRDDEQLARWAFVGASAYAVVVFWVVGRHQWFIRDDWAVILTRRRIEDDGRPMAAYLSAQDGHWMTVPVLVYRAIEAVFGLASYWPFLIPCLAAHLASVVLVRVLCRRVGASAWTTTALCATLLVLGGGWENIVFAVQITYNLTLLAFIAQVLLVDHSGPADRRDVVGTVLALIGTASSGFGPIFVFGVALLLVLRRRRLAAVVAVAPSALAYLWWWFAYGGDRAADDLGRPLGRLPSFVDLGVTSTFDALLPVLSGAGIVAVTAVVVWRRRDPRAHDVLVALVATMLLMFVAVGVERVGAGVETAASSRYVYMAAFLAVPALAVAIDQLGRLGRPVMIAGWLLVAAGAVVQSGLLVMRGSEWAMIADRERHELALIAAAGLPPGADVQQPCLEFSPDVRCSDIDRLVDEGVVNPEEPVTELDRRFVADLADGDVVP